MVRVMYGQCIESDLNMPFAIWSLDFAFHDQLLYSIVFKHSFYPGGGVLLGILGGGVPPGSSNPDPISDLNMPFSTPVFRPDSYPFSDLNLQIYTRFQTWLYKTVTLS